MTQRFVVSLGLTLLFLPGCGRQENTPPGDSGAEGELRPKTDEERFEGTWAVVSFEENGKNVLEGAGKKVKWVIRNGMVFLTSEGSDKVDWVGASFEKVEPMTSPKSVNWSWMALGHGGEDKKGIYQFEGDRLTVCYGAERPYDRPTEFSAKAGSRQGLIVLSLETRKRDPRVEKFFMGKK